MNILIIGGSRFVGPLLVERLLRKKHRVTLFNRGLVQSHYRGVKFVQGDRDEGFRIRESFDVVIDMCAYVPEQTKTALEQLDYGFFVHMSTAAVYRKAEIFPLAEESALGDWPLWSGYNKGKVGCELVLQESGARYAAIRPVYVLGPKNYCDRERFIYSRIKAGIPLVIPGNGQALVQFIFAKDVAESIALIAEKKAKGAFNCAGEESITLRGLVDEMGKISGRNPIYRFNAERDGDRFDEGEFPFANENLVCSNAKLRKLGVEFTPLLEGLKEDYRKYYSKVI
jgi:nucleoside-diphosphate-sugar epimerase